MVSDTKKYEETGRQGDDDFLADQCGKRRVNPSNCYSPIALFIYNRPVHVKRTISALLKCDELSKSPLHIFCDGPKNSDDVECVTDARNAAKNLMPSHAQLHFCENNRGLAASIEYGVTYLCETYGRAIVLEDDLVVGHNFLAFMNAALDEYEASEKVMQVSAYMFPISLPYARRCFLLPLTTSWGWATWDRAWKKYDPMMGGWEILKSDKKTRWKFNVKGSFNFYSMLTKQVEGNIDSWAIRWYWSVFKNQGLVVYPPVSLIENTGFDGTGTHGWVNANRMLDSKIAELELELEYPVYGDDDIKCYDEISGYLKSKRYDCISYVKFFAKSFYKWISTR